ncbi:MAG: hypothetical protein ACXVBE_05485 [Bdellovibrionota bacterium]
MAAMSGKVFEIKENLLWLILLGLRVAEGVNADGITGSVRAAAFRYQILRPTPAPETKKTVKKRWMPESTHPLFF